MVGICRLCATICQKNALIVLTRNHQAICQQVRTCCAVVISMEDVLPKTVCEECILKLAASHEFYKKVQASQESLQAMFGSEDNDLLSQYMNCSELTEPQENEICSKSEEEQHNFLDDNSTDETAEIEYLNDEETDIYVIQKDWQHNEDMQINIKLINDTNIDTESNNKHLKEKNSLAVTNWHDLAWMCYICAERTTCYQQLVQHMLQLHQVQDVEILFRCADCHKTCTRYFVFLNHVRSCHYASLALCCDICNLLCVDNVDLAQHRQLCGKNQDRCYVAICSKCGKAFGNDSAQQLHERLQHNKLAVKHACLQCGKEFKRAFTLRMHERVHTEARHFTCNICGHAFRQKGNLETHMYAHSDNKRYECAICKKCFKTPTNLDKHGLTHTNIKQYKCQYCEKEFRTNDARISHERIHTGEMPFKCNYCDKRSRFRSTHLSHLKLHTGERPYECVECDHKFTNWSNYNKHMKRKHALAAETSNKLSTNNS